MNTTPVTMNVPTAEKDLVDALLIAFNDFKASKGDQVIKDEIPAVIKIAGELGELMTELKSKQSFVALAYLVEGLAA